MKHNLGIKGDVDTYIPSSIRFILHMDMKRWRSCDDSHVSVINEKMRRVVQAWGRRHHQQKTRGEENPITPPPLLSTTKSLLFPPPLLRRRRRHRHSHSQLPSSSSPNLTRGAAVVSLLSSPLVAANRSCSPPSAPQQSRVFEECRLYNTEAQLFASAA
ncbi:hypothetical protein ZWY2020_045464 [Hordeum vulgare]|nr:hypothetical protein ZWY2020_045464 [Hordeum vulgare]